ncbi:MAG: Na+/H+ antiporter NhaA [Gemmatimonadota bacterium]|nr:Na+/H+ antiporter NhaA [Gemmatimonadota bacterium]
MAASTTSPSAPSGSPATSPPVIERILRPFQKFAQQETSSGLVLLGCAVIALVWANSPWGASYEHLWEQQITIGHAQWGLTMSLHHWINDGLMAIFFFVVGLEIKRELLIGELSTRQTAALPIAGALGGMIAPALIYTAFNAGTEGIRGWGIPMATDIAFALGALALLGPRVPTVLKVFLAALAIADDLGAVVVIAVFYTADLSFTNLIVAAVIFAALLGANRLGVRSAVVYGLVGVLLWLAVLASGVHATIAGVMLALTIPARTRIDEAEFVARVEESLADFRAADEPGTAVLTSPGHQYAIHQLEEACEAAQAPLFKLEDKLHAFVAFFIMPLFALSNAGVRIGGGSLSMFASPIVLGIVLGLVLGKPIGITLFSWGSARTGIAALSSDVSWGSLHGVSWLGGIGFTMSLFVANLAFAGTPRLEEAKVGILLASTIAGVTGWLILKRTFSRAESRAQAA